MTDKLNRSLMERKEIVCSSGVVDRFPEVLTQDFRVTGVGIVICSEGEFGFSINGEPHRASAGETLFIPDDEHFRVTDCSNELAVSFLFYQVDNIRDIISTSVASMRFYSIFTAHPVYAWHTGEEEELLKYITLLGQMQESAGSTPDLFVQSERQLLLLALTHRLCHLYHHLMLSGKEEKTVHKHDTFIRLIRLIDQYYTSERGVEFYADKLCLSPKYLSALSKSICGLTVQELVFKAIVRKSISLLKNTGLNVQEISDYFNFPNASYFGTFFKKQTGQSPQHYREA